VLIAYNDARNSQRRKGIRGRLLDETYPDDLRLTRDSCLPAGCFRSVWIGIKVFIMEEDVVSMPGGSETDTNSGGWE